MHVHEFRGDGARRAVALDDSLARLMWSLVAVATIALIVTGSAPDRPVTGSLSVAAEVTACAVCWRAVRRAVRHVGYRLVVEPLVAAAVTFYAIGDTVSLVAGDEGSTVLSSFADTPYFLFGLTILVALLVLVSRQLRGVTSLVLLDGAVGSLGAAAVLALAVGPSLDSILDGRLLFGALVDGAYPLFDLALIALSMGIVAARGLTLRGRWPLLVLGLSIFAATDVRFALLSFDGRYAAGTLLEIGWPLGLALVAAWLRGTARSPGPATANIERGDWAMAVPPIAALCGIGVLVSGRQTQIGQSAVVLASLALVGASARTLLAFRALGRLVVLRAQTRTDELTGLPNRRVLYEEAPARLAPGKKCALLLLDLDKFKVINDSLGHDTGDLLLVQVTERLGGQLGPKELLIRLGGDEFAILQSDAGQADAVDLAVRLHDALASPFSFAGLSIFVNASVGIALFPAQGATLTDLLRKADVAMYKAKSGRESHHVFRVSDDDQVADRLRTLGEFRNALAGDELVLHFQPKIDLATGQVRGVEALVRWNHPQRGLLYPDAFLALVEESGLMPELTHVVLGKALDQAASWKSRGTPLSVAVNFSASSLIDVGIPGRVRVMLAERSLPASALLVEVTEEFLMKDSGQARYILSTLRRMGIRIAMDDFGTGYSSLAYLRDLPIDELKLDRSFVTAMTDDARAAALVASTIDLAHSLGLTTVAEGIEEQADYDALAEFGCEQGQGYLMSRPVPAEELDRWLGGVRPAWVAR
jgi:diguanylate cyclase